MVKIIVIRYCKECPKFCCFPFQGYDGQCAKLNRRVVDENSVPDWCQLQEG